MSILDYESVTINEGTPFETVAVVPKTKASELDKQYQYLLSLINELQDVWLEDKDSWYGAESTIPAIQALIANQVEEAYKRGYIDGGINVITEGKS